MKKHKKFIIIAIFLSFILLFPTTKIFAWDTSDNPPYGKRWFEQQEIDKAEQEQKIEEQEQRMERLERQERDYERQQQDERNNEDVLRQQRELDNLQY